MKLNRTDQIFLDNNYQYLVLNKFHLSSKIENEKQWVIDFFNSDYFKINARIDYIKKLPLKKQKTYLPIVFNLDKLLIEDFVPFDNFLDAKKEIIADYKKHSIYNYEDGSAYDKDDLEEFERQLEIVQNNSEIGSRAYFISQDWYKNTDKKIHEVFHFAGFINTYYYLILIIGLQNDLIISVEMGFD